MNPNDELLTVREAAELAKVNPASLRKWIRRGQLAAQKFGRDWRIRRAAIVGFDTRPESARGPAAFGTEPLHPTAEAILRKAGALN